MARASRKAQTLLVLVALAAAAGCDPAAAPVAEVHGVVRLDGKPLPEVRIQFLPDPQKGNQGPASSGATDGQGRFELVCADERPGAVVGWHRVVITDMRVRLRRSPRSGRRDDEQDEGVAKQKPPLSRVPAKYTTAAHTPLAVAVTAEKQELAFDLTR